MDTLAAEGARLPDSAELLTLLEKQDGILSLLFEELEVCKAEISSLQSMKRNKATNFDSCNAAAVNSENEHCRRCKQILFDGKCFGIEGCSRDSVSLAIKEDYVGHCKDVTQKFSAMEKAQLELRECKMKVELLSQELESCRCELALEKESTALKQGHIDRLNLILKEERERTDHEISRVGLELSAAKCEIDRLKEETSLTNANFTTVNKAMVEKDVVLKDYAERLKAEALNRKQENLTLNRRIAVLMEENTVLRSSLASMKGSQQFGYGLLNVNNLLEDQQNLIATLKEECELLANRLRDEKKGFKAELRRLKRVNKDLTAQLDRLIAGER